MAIKKLRKTIHNAHNNFINYKQQQKILCIYEQSHIEQYLFMTKILVTLHYENINNINSTVI